MKELQDAPESNGLSNVQFTWKGAIVKFGRGGLNAVEGALGLLSADEVIDIAFGPVERGQSD